MEFQSLLHNGDVASALLRINHEHSARFVNAKLSRQTYRSTHPTEIIWLKCMDGRLNGSVFTQSPFGIISPFRAAGAKFDLGWPYFMEKVAGMVNYASSKGRECLFFCTYHYSAGSHDRGCAAFHLDTNAGRDAAFSVRKQFQEAFPAPDNVVHAIVVGLETDEDSLVLHSNDGKTTLKLTDINSAISADELQSQVQQVYPELPAHIVRDLLPLLHGNLRHIDQIRKEGRAPEELNHREVALCLGRGFPWLHTPNRAIIIGPWEQWETEVAIGGGILLKNLKAGRVPESTKFVFMVSAPYRELGTPEHRLAPFKARYLYQQGMEVLRKEVPELIPHITSLVGTIYQENLLFEPIQI